MEKPNYFNEWRAAGPVTFILAVVLIGSGVGAAILGVVAGLIFEVTGMADPGDQSNRWAIWAAGLAYVFIAPVGVNRAMTSHYQRQWQDGVMRDRRIAYAHGVADQRDGRAREPDADVAAEVAATRR